LNPLSASYAQVARIRRAWYERRPHRRRQLGCPVISVGNLAVGGSGKTPVVAAIAELLRDAGYAPAIVSRGYKRRGGGDVVAVSDGRTVLAGVEQSGDEPQMLARRLTGIPVLVSADRVLAGVMAQQRFAANVVILDDAFQHLRVERTIDLLMLTAADLEDAVLPAGRLREPLDAARYADAVLVPEGSGDAAAVARRAGVTDGFAVRVAFAPLRSVTPFGGTPAREARRVVAVAGIARPTRFFSALRSLGYDVARELAFRDHHWFTAADITRVEDAARATGADAIVMTEKDAVRWGSSDGKMAAVYLPMHAHVEPAEAFRDWLLAGVRRGERTQA
jgi:tetraacyldisaccharide 4'-kinase